MNHFNPRERSGRVGTRESGAMDNEINFELKLICWTDFLVQGKLIFQSDQQHGKALVMQQPLHPNHPGE